MVILSTLLIIYISVAGIWALGWYSEYEACSEEDYSEERKTSARNLLLTPVGPIIWASSFVAEGARVATGIIRDAFPKKGEHNE